MKLRIATRKSALALWQAGHVAERLRTLAGVSEVELVPMTTRGDEIQDRSLQAVGGKGLFIKELEVALEEGRADVAVHSMKDVPGELPAGFAIAAVLGRANPADALIGRRGMRLEALDDGAVVGSSSLRRAAQLKRLRPGLKVLPLRGNVNTRLQKLEAGEFDAIVLAVAGLERLGLAGHISQVFTCEEMLPAAAQGVLGIECRAGDARILDVVAALNDPATAVTTAAERAVARRFNASCLSPVAAHARTSGDELTITALVATPDGRRCLRDSLCGKVERAEAIGRALAERMLGHGAREILDEAERAVSGSRRA
ncbi:MAG TPA: hydroxymethylbilane synthase [Woeseiaceae bacterium]|nr:hydroxymethylbilane synthase [Woeseiaceae bacterium]